MRNARKLAGIVAGVLAFSLIAAACGSDNNDSGSSGSTGATGGTGSLSGSIVISGPPPCCRSPTSSPRCSTNRTPTCRSASTVREPATDSCCSARARPTSATRRARSRTTRRRPARRRDRLRRARDRVRRHHRHDEPGELAVTCLNYGDLYALFGPESEGIDTWDGANSLAKQVGGNGGFPTRRSTSRPRAPSRAPTTRSSSFAGSRTSPSRRACPEDEAASLRTDYQSSPDDNVIIQAMEGSDSALGFVGFAYAEGRATRSRSSRSTAAAAASRPRATRSRTAPTRSPGRSTSTSTRRRSRATPR